METKRQNGEAQAANQMVEYFTRRPRCARCEFLKAFQCEHKTPVRDFITVKYLDEGKHYMEPKAQPQPQIKRFKYNETRMRNDSEFSFSLDKSNQCARCRQMNAFICEHNTNVRDNIFEKYSEEGRYYTPVTPRPRFNQITQPSLRLTNNLKSKSTKTFNSNLVEESLENLNESTRVSFLDEKTNVASENEKVKNETPVNLEITQSENEIKKPVINSKQQQQQQKDKQNKLEEPKKSGGCCSVM